MEDSFRILQDVRVYVGAHWSSRLLDGQSSVHLNMIVSRAFLPRLTDEAHASGFAQSVQACIGLLMNPWFGGQVHGEQWKLSTDVAGVEPVQYVVNCCGKLPGESTITQLGEVFEGFVRSFSAGPVLPRQERTGEYLCASAIDFHQTRINNDTRVELKIRVPATFTPARLHLFRQLATAGLSMQLQGGRQHLDFYESSSVLGAGYFSVHGEMWGRVPLSTVKEQLSELFDRVVDDLNL